jgi:hypothetical protein
MAIEANYSMQTYIGRKDPEQKYVEELMRIRHDKPGITSQDLFSAFCKYMETDPSDVYMSNEARELFLERNFIALTFPAPSAVSILRSCDTHLETLVFTSFGYAGGKFSSLVLREYSQIRSTSPEYKLADSTEENFDKSPAGRLLAIKAVFDKYLRNPRTTSPGWKELSGPHADYDRLKKQISQILLLHGLGGLSPQRLITTPTSPYASLQASGDELRTLLAADNSPQRRELIQRRFAELITSRSPPREAETAFQTAAVPQSSEKLIPAIGSSTLPVETTVPENRLSSPVEVTTKPTIEVVTPPRGPRRSQLVVTGTAARALAAATRRAVTIAPDGKITCTIRK